MTGLSAEQEGQLLKLNVFVEPAERNMNLTFHPDQLIDRLRIPLYTSAFTRRGVSDCIFKCLSRGEK